MMLPKTAVKVINCPFASKLYAIQSKVAKLNDIQPKLLYKTHARGFNLMAFNGSNFLDSVKFPYV